MENQKSFREVVQMEKQLVTLMYSKGIRCNYFQNLYRKIRTAYEKVLLNNDQMVELQEVEYHLWKLHYKLIDGLRKRNRQSNAENELGGFFSFLRDATDFYGKLIVKIRKRCGLPDEIFLKSNRDSLSLIESTKLQACQYTCHRLLICLGDIARYVEVIKKPNASDWSTAAKYYIEATKTWPDSGNPHNQLALLATYVGDDFLALYHCVRSLAVNVPFPDAWRNLMLILEENKSTQFQMLSSEMQIDFSNLSKRISSLEENNSSNRSKLQEIENISELWPLFVRMLDLLVTRSSLEEFPSAFATTLHKLESLLTLDDTKISATLESYKNMDMPRTGPYRSLQLVSVFIFIVHYLTRNPKRDSSMGKDDQHPLPTPFAFAAMFICMGRLTERCMMGNPSDVCPLLPALMVFSEWLVGALDETDSQNIDERVVNANSYFMNALVDLLDRLEEKVSEVELENNTALWEDHELMGFYPLKSVHESLDFMTHIECREDFRIGNELRLNRLFHAATKIIDRFKGSLLNKGGRGLNSFLERNELAKTSMGKEDKSTIDEEEVILFNPITRRNSAPLYITKHNNDLLGTESTAEEETLYDEILRRATSLSVGRAIEADSFSFCTTTSDSSRNRSGPPSLSAWVLNQEVGREKGSNSYNKQNLSPIDELASTFSCPILIDPEHISTISDTTTPYVTPLPSAPSLPQDAANWFSANLLISTDYKTGTSNGADGILGAALISPYQKQSTLLPPVGVSGLVDGYPPFTGMTSSEWLYHYRNSQNVANTSNRTSPMNFNDHAFGKLSSNEVTFDLCDQWGNRFISTPTMYMSRPQMYPNPSFIYEAADRSVNKLFLDYQRPYSYVCGVGMELGSDQLSTLQYLKDKEWQMQTGLQFKGPSFMRN